MKLHSQRLQTVDEIRSFLNGVTTFDFEPQSREASYQWICDSLRPLRYSLLGKADRGVVKAYLEKVSGRSRAQITRLIRPYRNHGRIRDHRGRPANAFSRRYTPEDVALLVETDTLHGHLSGPATRKLCERAFAVFGDDRYQRLAGISNGHLYNLRHSDPYQRRRRHFRKTRYTPVRIGERRKPRPNGRPGFLRVDTVHQGDQDGVKGLYHINAVDEVTQMQAVVCVQKISESYLIPALHELLDAFPFTLQGFHSDNGSEYINRQVAQLLQKLHIEQTKSRPRQSNDNALVEGKNGSVLRKHLGYEHISQRFAQPVNHFLIHYLNYHRPCLFAKEEINHKGKRIRKYPDSLIQTPYEKLRALPDAEQYLKSGITFKILDDFAHQYSDNEAARRLNKARNNLFQSFNKPRNHAA